MAKPAIKCNKKSKPSSKKAKSAKKNKTKKRVARGNRISQTLSEPIKENIVRATMGFEQLISSISNQHEKHLSEPKFDTSALHTFQNVPQAIQQTAPAVEDSSNKATILTIAPHFTFIYWDVPTPLMIETAHKTGPKAQLVLRFYDTTNSDDLERCQTWDIEIFDRKGNFYLKLENPEQKLHLEIGMRGETGIFSRISKADAIFMPEKILNAPGPLKWIKGEAGLTEVNPDMLKKILGPYFYDLLMRGRFASVANSSAEAMFHNVETFKINR